MAALAVAIALQVDAHAATVAGVQFREVIRLHGEELVLASCGVRSTLWIEHYVAGLYVPRETQAALAVRDPNKSKVLIVKILNPDHFPQQVPEKWREPLQSSLSAEEFSQVSLAYEKLRKGDTMLYTYSPDTGFAMTVNGQTVAIAGHSLIDALLRTWQRDDDPGTLRELLQGNNC